MTEIKGTRSTIIKSSETSATSETKTTKGTSETKNRITKTQLDETASQKKASQDLASARKMDTQMQSISQKMDLLKELSAEQKKQLETAKQKDAQSQESDTDSSKKVPNYEYLKMAGADGILTESELQVAAADSQKLKDFLSIVSNGQLLGSSDDSISKAKQEYMKNPSAGTLNNELFKLVAESQNAPVDAAKDAGLTNPSDLLKLASDLAMLGTEDVGKKMSDAATYKQIKEKGRDSVLADAFRDSMSLPESAKGMNLKQLIDGTAVAQDLGVDQTDSGFWDKVRKEGIAGVIDQHRKTKGEGGDGTGGRTNKIVNKPYGRFAGKIIHSDQSTGKSQPHNAASNPVHTPDNSQQGPNATKSKSTQSTSRNFSDRPERQSPSFTRATGSKPRSDQPAQTTNNASATPADPDAPTQGTNPQGGAANVYGPGEGKPEQTGVGNSSPVGTEAGSGAVISAVGYERNSEGQITVTWQRTGGMDGQDGFYNTTYTQNNNGTWSYTVTDAITGEEVNSGTGDPPSEDIINTSTQEVGDDGTIYFPTEEEDDDEGKPLPAGIGFDRPDVVRRGAWSMPHDIDKPVDYLPPELRNSRPAVVSAGDVLPKNPGNVDPVDPELQQTRVAKGGMRRSDGYTDPAETGSGGRSGVDPKDQPPGPSHAKRKRGSNRMQQNMVGNRRGPGR